MLTCSEPDQTEIELTSDPDWEYDKIAFFQMDATWDGAATGTYGCMACFSILTEDDLKAGHTGIATCGDAAGNNPGEAPEFYGYVEATSDTAF